MMARSDGMCHHDIWYHLWMFLHDKRSIQWTLNWVVAV